MSPPEANLEKVLKGPLTSKIKMICTKRMFASVLFIKKQQ